MCRLFQQMDRGVKKPQPGIFSVLFIRNSDMKNRIITYLATAVTIAAFWLHGSAGNISRNDVEVALRQLDGEIKNIDGYMARRECRIDSIKRRRSAMAPGSKEWLESSMEIARSYNSFNNDSALAYYTEGLDMARAVEADSLVTEFRVRRATYLTLSGYIHDALYELQQVDTTRFDKGLWRTYHDATRQMYSYISTYYDGRSETYDRWNNMSISAQKRLLPLLDRNSDEYKLNLGEYYFSCREYAKSNEVLSELVKNTGHDTRTFAIASHILAQTARVRGDRNGYLYHLANSAIADAKMATLEVTSIQELGGTLFEIGETRRAHDYLRMALENAVSSRAAVRMNQTSSLLTMVDHEHNRQVVMWRRISNVTIVIMGVLLVALGTALWYLRRQLKRVDSMKQHLEEANKTKDVYISQFLTLSSIYMDKLQQFSKLVNRKLSAGQVEELQKLTKSGKFIEEQSKEFYSVFDDAFLHIYPDFPRKVNELLRPEEQIVPAEGELLNSDLRILAFMRLGIDDAQRVAQILNYSVNTIYAYRNKLRNRAINRDSFEKDIMAIG